MKKVLIVLSLLAVTVFFISGSGFAKSQALVYGTTEKVTDMDPCNAYDFHTWEIFYNIYQGLMGYPPGETNLVPGLAESYTISDDGKAYTFNLKKGLKFSDGTPFDSQTVKWSIDRVMRIAGDPSWLVTDFVESVEAVDKYRVKFNLKNPVAYFPSLVATPPYYPVNPNVYPADKIVKNPSELKGGKLVGLGPYQAVSFKRDEEIVLDLNPYYAGDKPLNDRVVIRYFADATTMRLALEKGELDFAFKSFNPSDIKDLENSSKIKTIKGQGPYIRYVCFQCETPPFDDKVVRQGIAAALNRKEIIKKVFLGQNAPLYSMVPMGMWTHTDSFKFAFGDGNIAKAKELLASKGFNSSNKLKFDFWYTPSHYGDTEVDMAAVIKSQLEATGVMEVTVKSAEWATYKQNWHQKLMPVYLLGWYPDYIDPDNYTAAFAGTAGSKGNGIYFSSPVWDALFVEGQKNPDPAKRAAVYGQVQQMWTDEVPTAPIFQGTLYLFSQKNIEGIMISPTLQFIYAPIKRTE
ncbi:MAG: ABC transporter substrate-binding protein [Deltaproteobacteria bacterium]|nr:ABC transporter substrate-binding protein [Deltaproteobacteria bacterium]